MSNINYPSHSIKKMTQMGYIEIPDNSFNLEDYVNVTNLYTCKDTINKNFENSDYKINLTIEPNRKNDTFSLRIDGEYLQRNRPIINKNLASLDISIRINNDANQTYNLKDINLDKNSNYVMSKTIHSSVFKKWKFSEVQTISINYTAHVIKKHFVPFWLWNHRRKPMAHSSQEYKNTSIAIQKRTSDINNNISLNKKKIIITEKEIIFKHDSQTPIILKDFSEIKAFSPVQGSHNNQFIEITGENKNLIVVAEKIKNVALDNETTTNLEAKTYYNNNKWTINYNGFSFYDKKKKKLDLGFGPNAQRGYVVPYNFCGIMSPQVEIFLNGKKFLFGWESKYEKVYFDKNGGIINIWLDSFNDLTKLNDKELKELNEKEWNYIEFDFFDKNKYLKNF